MDAVENIRPCKHGVFTYLPNDFYIGKALELYGEYSEGEASLFNMLLKPGMVAVEVGANIGALTIPLAKVVGPTGRVYAFEPQRVIFQMLCANLALNKLHNVFAINVALGAQRGSLGVPKIDYNATANFGGVTLIANAEEMTPVGILDDLNLTPHFVKLDCEGMEAQVLAGAKGTIMRARPILYVENDRKQLSAALVEALIQLGYRLFWHIVPMVRVQNYREAPIQPQHNIVSVMMLCVPNEMQADIKGLEPVIDPVHPIFMNGGVQ